MKQCYGVMVSRRGPSEGGEQASPVPSEGGEWRAVIPRRAWCPDALSPSFPSGAWLPVSCCPVSCRAQLLPSLPRGGAGGGVPIFLYVNLPKGWGNNAKRHYSSFACTNYLIMSVTS